MAYRTHFASVESHTHFETRTRYYAQNRSDTEIKWIEDFIALSQYQSISRAAEFRNVALDPIRYEQFTVGVDVLLPVCRPNPRGAPIRRAFVSSRLRLPRHATRDTLGLPANGRLPRVEIVDARSNMDGAQIDHAIADGAKGIVLAGEGDGDASREALAALDRAAKKGIVVVRSTRVMSGFVNDGPAAVFGWRTAIPDPDVSLAPGRSR
nr:hypothetical protein [Paraburkholderia aromaticivorans]